MDDHVTHIIGKPVTLSDRDIRERRKALEQQYESEATPPPEKQARGTISGDELLALRRFDDLNYLEEARP